MGHTEQKAQGVSPVVGPVLIKGEAAGRGSSNLPGIPKTLRKEECHISDWACRKMEAAHPSSSTSREGQILFICLS